MKRQIVGSVTSDSGDKTIVISVAERRTHPLYKKQYTVTSKYIAHDKKNEAKVGDKVVIIESKPKSRRKRFQLDTIVSKAGIAFSESDATADVPEDEILSTTNESEVKKTDQEKVNEPRGDGKATDDRQKGSVK